MNNEVFFEVKDCKDCTNCVGLYRFHKIFICLVAEMIDNWKFSANEISIVRPETCEYNNFINTTSNGNENQIQK